MTKKKPKKSKAAAKEPTLAEKLGAQAREVRNAGIAWNVGVLIEGGEKASVRRSRANLARKVMKRAADRKMLTTTADVVTFPELRILCGAALAHEALAKKATGTRRTSDRVAKLAGKVLRVFHGDETTFTLGSEKVTAGDVRSLAASCLNQDERRGVRGKR
jgi:hypothetical protein